MEFENIPFEEKTKGSGKTAQQLGLEAARDLGADSDIVKAGESAAKYQGIEIKNETQEESTGERKLSWNERKKNMKADKREEEKRKAQQKAARKRRKKEDSISNGRMFKR